ncbi:hypothetical protein [Psychromonas sp. MME2]|uniref:hypothetical protein n=1 Tax=Psychromonas sp. MME2 TaxID=3231033 RepID=UPI00339BCFCC
MNSAAAGALIKCISSESKLHIRLLNRTTRKVSLTEAGMEYYHRCQQILDDIEEMEGALTNLHQNISGLLTISAPPEYLAKNGTPNTAAELQGHSYLKYSGSDQDMIFLNLILNIRN